MPWYDREGCWGMKLLKIGDVWKILIISLGITIKLLLNNNRWKLLRNMDIMEYGCKW